MQHLDTQENPLFQRAQELRARGINPYAKYFNRSHTLLEVNEMYEDVQRGEEKSVGTMLLCGRVMSITVHNEAVVIRIEDQEARFQLIACGDKISSKRLSLLKTSVYRGDYLGFEVSTVCRINTFLGAVIDDWYFLSLAHLPIPKSMEVDRQRNARHMYWASNIDAREVVVKRSKILYQTRQYLNEHDILEVHTPHSDGGQRETGHATHTWAMCQLLVGGIEQVYEIRPNDKPNPIDWLNHPQALLLECYMAMRTPHNAMQLIEQLILRLSRYMHAAESIDWLPLERLNTTTAEIEAVYIEDQCLEIDLSAGWAWRSVPRLTHDILGVDFASCRTLNEAVNTATHAGLHLSGFPEWRSANDVMMAAFRQFVAPALIQPTFVIYPLEGEEFIERFELYVNGILFGCGHTEVLDPMPRADEIPQANMSQTLMVGMPPATRFTLYLDRVVMLLLGAVDIRDVISFP